MRFLDRAAMTSKFIKVSEPRNQKLMQALATNNVHPLFSIIPQYLGSFYQGIYDDRNSANVLRAFSNINEKRFDAINRLLVFWHFYTLDAYTGNGLLEEQTVKNGFKDIWSTDEKELKDMADMFKKLPLGEDVVLLWKMICAALDDMSLSPVFALVHLRNAQKSTMEFAEGRA